MTTIEIFLLCAGGIIFLLSFMIPVKKEKIQSDTKDLIYGEIHNLLENEVKGVQNKLEGIVDETVNYSVEKAERSLERLSNEKIMAVNEYSDTVLEEIHKNHQEVLFLYDMLNNKHQDLKEAVITVDRTVKEAEHSSKENTAEPFLQASDSNKQETEEFEQLNPEKLPLFREEESKNSNERILELYAAGKSQVEIAKALGMGVGEVKLVLALFQ